MGIQYKLRIPMKIGVSTCDKQSFTEQELGCVFYRYGARQSVTLPVGEIVEYDGGNGYDISHWKLPNRLDSRGQMVTFGCDSGGHEWLGERYGEVVS